MNQLSRLGNSISIPLQPDEEGYIGRECPNTDCEGYFKIMGGTGLKEITHCYCPYCGHKAEHNEFFTKEQIDYAKSVAIRKITDAVVKDFKKLEFNIKPKGGFGIGMSLKVKEGPRHPIYWYREKQLETYVECNNCTLKYAVYGAFGFCPDCGTHNSFQILEKSLEVVIKTLKLSDTTQDTEIKNRLIENALEDCVSAFDGYGRELCCFHKTKSNDPDKAKKISFQNLESAKKKVFDLFGLDISKIIDSIEWNKTVRGFQKRHLLAHKMGIVDEEYLKRTGDTNAIKGRKISVIFEEVQELVEIIKKLAKHIKDKLP